MDDNEEDEAAFEQDQENQDFDRTQAQSDNEIPTGPWDDYRTPAEPPPEQAMAASGPWDDFASPTAATTSTPSDKESGPWDGVAPKATEPEHGQLHNFFRSLAREIGLQGWAVEPLKGAGRLISPDDKDNFFTRTGENLERGIESLLPQSKADQETIGAGVGKGVGDIVPLVAATLLGVGPGLAFAGAQMGLGGVESQSAAAEAKGASPDTVQKAGYLGGAVGGGGGLLLGAAGSRLLPALERSAPGLADWASKLLTNAAREGVVFTGIGEAQEYLNGEIAKHYYDPNAEHNFDLKRLATEFLTGAVFGAGKQIVSGGYRSTTQRVQAGDTEAAADQQTTARSEATKTGVGVAQAQARPSEQVTGVGNEASAPERSAQLYEKRREAVMGRKPVEQPTEKTPEQPSRAVTELQPGEIAPDTAAALKTAHGDSVNLNPESPQPATPAVRSEPPTPQPSGVKPPIDTPAPPAPPPPQQSQLLPGARPSASQRQPNVSYPRPAPVPWDRPMRGNMTVSPELKRAVRTDNTHDVPWLAGTSNDGKTVYFDPRMPDQIDVGGKILNPKQPVIVHELRERAHEAQLAREPEWANKGRDAQYEEAHRRATIDEEQVLAKRGYSPEQIKSYQEQMDVLARKTEAERAQDRHPPADLWTKIYPKEEAAALKREAGPPNPEVITDLHRAAREVPQRVAAKMAVLQKGELFGPEGARFDQPTPVTERVPAKRERGAPEQGQPVTDDASVTGKEPARQVPPEIIAEVKRRSELHREVPEFPEPQAAYEHGIRAGLEGKIREGRYERQDLQASFDRGAQDGANFKVGRLPEKEQPKIDRAIALAKANNLSQKMIHVLEKARENPKLADVVANRFLAEYTRQGKSGVVRERNIANVVEKPAAPERIIDRPVAETLSGSRASTKEVKDYSGRVIGYANTESLARKRSNSLRIAGETMERFKSEREFDPTKADDVAAYKSRAAEIVEHATNEGWTKYLSRQDVGGAHLKAPREALWIDEQQAVARGSRKVADAITREKLLRAGDEDAADLVRDQRLEEGDARMKRVPRVEDVERANAKGSPGDDMENLTGRSNLELDARIEKDEAFYTSPEGKPTRVETLETKKLREVFDPDTGVFANRNEAYKALGREIAAQEPNVPVHTVSHADMDRIGKEQFGVKILGFYDPNQRSILVRPGSDAETMLHEGVHAITSNRIFSNPELVKLIRGVMDEVNRIDPNIKRRFNDAFKNEKEFLAWGMSNPRFQDALSGVKIPPEVAKALGLPEQAHGRITDGFRAFVNAIRQVMGLNEGHYTALEAVVKLTDIASKVEDRTRPTFGKRKTDPQVQEIDAQVQQVRQQGDDLLKQSKAPKLLRLRDLDKIAQDSDKLFGGAKVNPIRTVHKSIEKARVQALANVRLDEPLLRKGIDLKAQHPDAWRDLEHLVQDESMFQRFGDVPLDKQGFSTKGLSEEWANSKHPDLEKRWNALPADLKNYRAELYDYTEQRHEALAHDTTANRLMRELGITDDALVSRVLDGTHTEADYKRLGTDDRQRENMLDLLQEAGSISALKGPYTPFIRRGKFAVTGQYKLVDPSKSINKLDDNTHEFATRQDAVDFAKQQHGRPAVSSYYVDKTTGERYSKVTEPVMKGGEKVLDPQGNPRTYEKEVAYAKGDPNTEQRFRVRTERGYLRMMDTYRDALAHEKDLRDSQTFDKTDAQKKKFQPHTDVVTLASNLTNLEAKLGRNVKYENMTANQKETVQQLIAEHYLQMLSSTRVQNSRLHRNYVRGADENLLRNLQDYSQETGTRLASMKEQPNIDKAMKTAEAMVNENNIQSKARRDVLNEVSERVDSMKGGGFRLASGQMGPVMHRLMSWSYMARLATPGFTIRNLTQPGLFSLPEIGARHGFGATGREMLRVYRNINTGSILAGGVKDTGKAIVGKLTDPLTFVADIRNRLSDPQEKKFLDSIVETGHIDRDAGFNIPEHLQSAEGVKVNLFNARKNTKLTRGIERGLTATDKALHWMEEVSRQMPRAAEIVNRAATGVLAFRMEMKRTNDYEQSVRYAEDVLDNTQFRYTDTNKPTWQRSPWARAAFQFKQFGKSSYEFLGRHIGNAISRETDPETRKASMKALGGLFVSHTVMAGALGLPWEPVRALLIGAKAGGITNKEWDDVENAIREGLTGLGNLAGFNEKNSKKIGEALSRGMPRLLGLDMSPGLGLENMLLFGSPRSGTDREMDNNLSAWMFNMIGGAPTGLQMQMLHGLRDVIGGDYASGIAKLMPMKIGSDVIKAEEGYRKGKVNARGRETMAPYSLLEAGYKAMGLPVAREAETNAFQHQVYQQGQEIKDAKSKATAAWLTAKDPEAKNTAFKRAIEAGLTPKDLTAAQQREISGQKRVVNGAMTTKDTRPIAERLRNVYNME